MKRTFIVEIDYEELEENTINKTEVLQEISVEIVLDNMMRGYIDTNSLEGNYYSVDVRELK